MDDNTHMLQTHASLTIFIPCVCAARPSCKQEQVQTLTWTRRNNQNHCHEENQHWRTHAKTCIFASSVVCGRCLLKCRLPIAVCICVRLVFAQIAAALRSMWRFKVLICGQPCLRQNDRQLLQIVANCCKLSRFIFCFLSMAIWETNAEHGVRGCVNFLKPAKQRAHSRRPNLELIKPLQDLVLWMFCPVPSYTVSLKFDHYVTSRH